MNCMQDKNCLNCNEKSPLFKVLNNAELQLINENKRLVTFKKGEVIVKQGAPMSHVLSFISGIAKVYIEGTSNRNLVLQFIKPTNFLGTPGIYANQIHYSTVSAVEESSVCFIDIHVFKEIISGNKQFANEFMKLISLNGIFNYERFICLTQKNIHGRLADGLIYLHEKVFDKRDHNIVISSQDIAEFTGMSRDSVIRTIKEFQTDKLLKIDKSTILIKDIKKLKKISELG